VDSQWLQRAVAAGVVLALALVVARLVDRAIFRRLELSPETLTRYRVLRRSIVVVIVGVGVLSALLVIPEVRAVAGTILASSAVVALVVGLAAQATLSNFVAGILIALLQPLRLGDAVSVGGAAGTVDEVGLMYTIIRADDGARFFVPNTRLASDTIRNATIASTEHLAAVRVSVPLSADLDRVLGLLVDVARQAPEAVSKRTPIATITDLEVTAAVVTVEAWAGSAGGAVDLAARVRREAVARLRGEGVYA
jgi:small-conductance mechanosensitive channel